MYAYTIGFIIGGIVGAVTMLVVWYANTTLDRVVFKEPKPVIRGCRNSGCNYPEGDCNGDCKF